MDDDEDKNEDEDEDEDDDDDDDDDDTQYLEGQVNDPNSSSTQRRSARNSGANADHDRQHVLLTQFAGCRPAGIMPFCSLVNGHLSQNPFHIAGK